MFQLKNNFIIASLAASLALAAGCTTPIPSSIGLGLVNEVGMSVKDLAVAALFSELCAAAGHDSETTATDGAIAGLSSYQRRKFDDWQSNRQYRRDIENSVNQRGCADHAKELLPLKSKTIMISDG